MCKFIWLSSGLSSTPTRARTRARSVGTQVSFVLWRTTTSSCSGGATRWTNLSDDTPTHNRQQIRTYIPPKEYARTTHIRVCTACNHLHGVPSDPVLAERADADAGVDEQTDVGDRDLSVSRGAVHQADESRVRKLQLQVRPGVSCEESGGWGCARVCAYVCRGLLLLCVCLSGEKVLDMCGIKRCQRITGCV